MGQQGSAGGPEGGGAVRDGGSRWARLLARFEPLILPAVLPLVLIVGLTLSVAAGFAACRAVGPYGDGPLGAGFRRLQAASAGETILVHDSRTGADVVRAVIDEQTGRVRELRLAPGGDFTMAVRVYLDENRGARVPRDLDGDGVADRWDYYADVRQLDSGAVERVGFSLAGDGIEDAWAFHDEQGRIVRVEVATLRDGVVDRWEHYRDGVLVRVEADADRDGRVDQWSTYRGGILSTTVSDADGDGFPDPPQDGER